MTVTTATTQPTIAPTFTCLTFPKFDVAWEMVGVEARVEAEVIDADVANSVEAVLVVYVLELVLVIDRDLLCVDVELRREPEVVEVFETLVEEREADRDAVVVVSSDVSAVIVELNAILSAMNGAWRNSCFGRR